VPRIAQLLVGLLAGIGSVIGLVALVPYLLQGRLYGPLGEGFLMLSTALYCFGIWTAVSAFRGRSGWVRAARWFWLAQVPMLQSPLASWAMFSGLGVWLYVRSSAGQVGAGASWYIGGGHFWSVSSGTGLLVLGVNVVALGIALALFRLSERGSQAAHAEA